MNGLYPQALAGERPTLGFLPLGTGNSFLRDFSHQGVEYAIESLLARPSRPCDVMRLRHRTGMIHYINLLSMGFSADVATLRARRFSALGRTRVPYLDLSDAGSLQPPPFPGAGRRSK